MLLKKKHCNHNYYYDVGIFDNKEAAIAYIRRSGDLYAFGSNSIIVDNHNDTWIATNKANYILFDTTDLIYV